MNILHDVLLEFSHEDQSDLYDILQHKFRSFLQINLDRIKNKRHLITEIDETVNKINGQEGNKYLYNPSINAFYEIHSDSIVMIHSDKILYQLKQYIPPGFPKPKVTSILKLLKHKIKENHLLEWIPPINIVQKYVDVCESFLLDKSCAYFFMYTIGSLILRQEEGGEDTPLSLHVWTGGNTNHIQGVVKSISRMIYDVFHHHSSFFNNQIKYEFTSKMTLSKVYYLYFVDCQETSFQPIAESSTSELLFMISSVFVYRNYHDLYKLDDSPVYFFRQFESRLQIYQYYLESNQIQGTQQLVFYNEIVEDFFDFLRVKSLPISVFADYELKHIISSCMTVQKINQQTFFPCSMNVNNTFCSYVRSFLLEEEIGFQGIGNFTEEEMEQQYECFLEFLKKKKWISSTIFTIKHFKWIWSWLSSSTYSVI